MSITVSYVPARLSLRYPEQHMCLHVRSETKITKKTEIFIACIYLYVCKDFFIRPDFTRLVFV